MIRSIAAIAIASVALFGAQSASAAPRAADQVTVSLKGADLSNPEKLQGRLAASAHAVCASEGDVDVFTAQADQACEQQALADAMAQLRAPQYSQLAMPADDSARYAVEAAPAGSR